MRSFLSKSIRQIGRNAVLAALVALPPLACTDLTEVPNDALTPDNAFKSDAELLAGIASVYARLRNPMWGYYNLSEITTDEIVVPTRGATGSTTAAGSRSTARRGPRTRVRRSTT
jgi:hypothetical protein